jgi:hypothetical protein
VASNYFYAVTDLVRRRLYRHFETALYNTLQKVDLLFWNSNHIIGKLDEVYYVLGLKYADVLL